jgi:UDP-N-acetylmuramoylalanine--D-glutamate ligase
MSQVEINGADVVVAGMGLSGIAAAELLRREGARVTATDIKPIEELPAVAAKLETLSVPFTPQSAATFERRDLVVLSPGVPADLPEIEKAREQGAPVVGDLELASWYLQGRIIGVTGSNGKTTTTSLIGHVLRESGVPAQVGGNIGFPPAAMVASSRADQWNVLELSSFQLETIRGFRADIALVLNITPDHLDRHHSMQRYVAAKEKLIRTQHTEDEAVLNADDPHCIVFGGWKQKPVWFSSVRAVNPGLYLDGDRVLYDGQVLMRTNDVPLRGRHNLENVMAAAAASRLAGVSLSTIPAAIETFPGVEHRLEFVRSINGVSFYNDSKATNVDATLKAVDSFSGGLWVILGGKDKGASYEDLRAPLREKARAALLIGAAAATISQQLGDSVHRIECGTLPEAVREAWRSASPGDTVLLAPACASFDQFDDYQHRGRAFKDLVANLEERNCA